MKIFRKIAALVIIAVGMAGLVLPVIPGMILIAIGSSMLFAGRDIA